MKLAARIGAIAALTLALVTGGAAWQIGFRAPPLEPLPLPERVVSLAAAEGQRLLTDGADSTDYPSLAKAFESQQRRAFCGVASSVVVLKALRRGQGPTQTTFVTDLPTELRVTVGGMTLDELGELLRKQRVETEVVHAEDTTLETFRRKARENLSRAGDYVLVNYQRSVLGQIEGGHISPLAAYNASSDRFLILDVAAYRYPPVWVSTADLWQAMNTVDPTSRRTRGFVMVRDASPS